MVRTEERDKQVGMAREGRVASVNNTGCMVVGSHEDLYNKDDAMRMREKIDKTEKEIVRLTMIAEKDKRESISLTNKIKRLKEQLQSLADNPQATLTSPEDIRRCHSESDLLGQLADRYPCSVTPPPSSLPSFKSPLANSSTVLWDTENKSPNISPSMSPLSDDVKHRQEIANLESMLVIKEDELVRVRQRAKEEAGRATSLRNEEEELKKALSIETEICARTNQDMKATIARKEKEIQRLTMLAEGAKRSGMLTRDQLEQQKRTLATFANARADKRPEILRIINSCDELVIPSSPSASSSGSSCGSISPLSLTPTSPSGFSLLRASSLSSGASCVSPLRVEMDNLLHANACKAEELSRVSAIAGMEESRAAILRTKSEEVKQVITSELQLANEELERKLRQIRNQQDAIHKVVARAEIERAKACLLHEELSNLTKAICAERHGGPAPLEIKKHEFLPDKAYLSEFKELTDLVPVSDPSTTDSDAPAPVANKEDVHTNIHSLSSQCGCVDPISFIQSPPCKQVSFCDSETVYVQRLRDLAVLDREAKRIDEELVRVKRLKEAEIVRRKLLLEKLKEVKEDYDYVRVLRLNRERESSRTF